MPVRELRSDARGGTTDLAFASGGALVVAGGRDGELRAWDLRAAGGSVLRQSKLTHGWTVGRRVRAGALNSLASSADGMKLHASPDLSRLA